MIHGATRTLGDKTYSVDGYTSKESCLRQIYRMALDDGWIPPPLREKWWQIFRPTSHPSELVEVLTDRHGT